jgi:hypothetical protein
MSKLDDILDTFGNATYDKASNPDCDFGSLRDIAKTEIKDLLLELIGKGGDVPENENMSWTEMRYQAAQLGINNLRAELRQRVEEL